MLSVVRLSVYIYPVVYTYTSIKITCVQPTSVQRLHQRGHFLVGHVLQRVVQGVEELFLGICVWEQGGSLSVGRFRSCVYVDLVGDYDGRWVLMGSVAPHVLILGCCCIRLITA